MIQKERNNRPAIRCTVLFDYELYKMIKSKAGTKDFKLYEYVNNTLAADIGWDPLYLSKVEKMDGKKEPRVKGSKHPSTKSKNKTKDTSTNKQLNSGTV